MRARQPRIAPDHGQAEGARSESTNHIACACGRPAAHTLAFYPASDIGIVLHVCEEHLPDTPDRERVAFSFALDVLAATWRRGGGR